MQYYDRPGRGKGQNLRRNSSRQPSAAEILEVAKRNREQRAHTRAQHAAATKIQSVLRTRLALRHYATQVDTAPVTSPAHFVHSLLFLAGLFDVSPNSVSESVSLITARVAARPFVSAFARKANPILDQSPLPSFDKQNLLSQSMLVKSIALLLQITVADPTLPSHSTQTPVPHTLQAACTLARCLTPSSLLALPQWGLPVHMSSLLSVAAANSATSPIPSYLSDLVSIILGLTNHPSVPAPLAATTRRQLALTLLAVDKSLDLLPILTQQDVTPLLLDALAPPEAPNLASPFVWDLGTDYTNLCTRSLVLVLSNILSICESWPIEENNAAWIFVAVLSSLISALPDDVVLIDDDEDDDVDLELTEEELRDRTATRSAMKRLGASLKSMVSENTVRTFFSAAVKEGRTATIRVSQLFNFLTRREKSLNMAFQNALAFWRSSGPHVLNSLWYLCREKKESSTADSSSNVVLIEESSPILVVFASAYSYLLYIQDANEILESSRPFSIEEVREIALVLKPYLFAGLFVKPIANLQESTAMKPAALVRKEPGLLDEIARLLSRLHRCDSQCEFRTSDDFWVVNRPMLTSEAFVQDATEAGDKALVQSEQVTDYGGVKEVTYNSSQNPSVSGAGELLRVAPFLIPFSTRAKVFYKWISKERELANGGPPFLPTIGRMVPIRRKFIFEDAFKELSPVRANLKATIRVKFIDEHGIEEAGIDGGGVFKEFMYEVMRLCFSPSLYGFFKATADGHLYPNPDAHIGNDSYKTHFNFLGCLLGKALFDGVLVNIPLASFFLSKILGQFNYPSDLGSLDPEMYKNMNFLKNCEPSLVEDLGLNFTVANNAYGKTDEVELIPNGKNISVNASNRIEYMHRVANYRMNIQIKEASEAFLHGFYSVVPSSYVRIFSQSELQLLISGKLGKIDLEDLRRHTKYSGGYNEKTPVIQWFWQVMGELDAEEQCRMLQFVTSSPRAPLLGFSYLVPGFCIHRAEGDIRLPTASTCMNLLKLPAYKTLAVVKEKLLYALNSNAGFDLS